MRARFRMPQIYTYRLRELSRARAAEEWEDEGDEWEGFRNKDGDSNVIDEVILDDATESFYREELKKLSADGDRFAAVPYKLLTATQKRRVSRLKKRLEGKSGAGTKHITVEQLNGYELYDVVQPPYNLDHLIDLSVENDTHYACITTKSINIVGLGYKWRERAKVKEARQAVEDDDGKIQKLSRKLQRATDQLDEWIEDLNIEEDFNEVLYKVWIDVEATGNGYLEVGRTLGGQVGYVGHIPSATMRVRKMRDGFVQIVQDKVTFFRNYQDRTTADPFGQDARPNEVIHFKKHSPKNCYYGVPDIISAMSSVAGEKFAAEYNLDYFENKAVPRYALIIKGAKLSMQAEKRLLEYFKREVKGKHHNTLYIPVPAHMGSNVDVQLQAIENKVQEGSFEKYRQGNRQSIAMVHRVPLSKLGISQGVAAAREDDKTFKVQVCQPEQRRVAKKINRIVSEKTDLFSFAFEEYDLLDAETLSRIHDRYVRIGVESPDEVRAERGQHPRKGGSKFIDLAAESAAKTELTLAQAEMQKTQAEHLPDQVQAQVTAAKARSDASATRGGGTSGPARQTTDGSPKNKQQTRTPATQTAAGKGTSGTAADRGETKSTRR